MPQPHLTNELISVNIVTWNSETFIKPCLESVLSQTYKNCRILVIDNASTDQTNEIVKGYRSSLRYIQLDRNTGFSHAHNIGFAEARGDYILVMNPDVILTPTYLEKAIEVMKSDLRVGAIGGKLYRGNGQEPSGAIDSTGIRFHPFKRVFSDCVSDDQEQREVFGVSGACALYRREVLEDTKTGSEYFDEDFFAYYEDVDLAWRARSLGWKAICVPEAVAYHYRTAAQKDTSKLVKDLIFRNRYFVLIKNDSLFDLLRVLPIFLLFEFLRHGKFLLTSPLQLLQWKEIAKQWPKMLEKRRMIQQKKRSLPSKTASTPAQG